MHADLLRFVAIVEHGKISAAAQSLGVTQSALTKTMGRLQAEFGFPLLARRAHGVELTETGRVVFERAQSIAAEYQLLNRLIEQANKTGAPVLRIGAGPIWSALYLQRILSVFRREFSHVQLEIRVHTKERLVELLLAGQLDIAICGTDVTVESALIEKEHLTNVETTIFGRLDHPLSRQSRTSAADFARYDWVAFEPREDYRASLSEMFRREGIAPPKPAIITSSWTSGILLVESSDALTTFPLALGGFLSKFGIGALKSAPVVQAFKSGLWFRTSLMDFAAGREFRRIARKVIAEGN